MLVLITMAVWRITSLLVYEDGPFRMFRHLRDFVGVGLTREPDGGPLTFFGGLLDCFWCTSIWVSTFVVALVAPILLALCWWRFRVNVVTMVVATIAIAVWAVLNVLAASCGAIVLETIVRRALDVG